MDTGCIPPNCQLFSVHVRNYFFPNQKQKIAAPRFLVPQMIIFLYVQAYPNYPPDKKFLPPEYRRELLTELLADDTILNDRG